MQNQQPSTNVLTFRFQHLALGLVLVGLYVVARPVAASAASLYFVPRTGTSAVGKTFVVSVLVSSTDQSMNAASGTVSFPVDKLQVVSLSKSGSIISLWVQEPSFSNSAGTVDFEGIVLNPGYTGSAGKILTITFKTRSLGSAAVTFSSGSVLANDGSGTNIVSSLGSASFGGEVPVTGPQAPEATTPVVVSGVPPAPQVSSTTHPDPNKWYANKNPTFTWVNPLGTDGVNVLADHNPATDPGTRSDGLRTSYTYQNVDDGVWYFHIRLHNSHGWGAVAHFRFQIDSVPPQPFSIRFIDGQPITNPTPTVLFDTTDQVSGMDLYRVKVGDQSFISVAADTLVKSNPYTLPPELPGKHTMLVQAFDQAGNYTTASQDFEITALDTPQLTDYPSELTPSDSLVVKGSTYPNATVTLTLLPDGREPATEQVSSDAAGKFVVTWPKKLEPNSYQFTVQVTDSRGAHSLPTEPKVVLVREQPLLHFGQLAVSYMAIIVTFVSLLLGLIAVTSYGFIYLRRLRRRLRQEVSAVEQVLHKSFKSLRTDLKSQLKLLDRARTKRELTLEEEKIGKQLQKSLDVTEAIVNREMKDIEHEVGR